MMATESPTSSIQKVVVHLRATGDAPILKQAKFKIAGTDKFAKVIDFLRRQLHRDTLFVYVNSAFSPNPDELVIDLYNIHNMLIYVQEDLSVILFFSDIYGIAVLKFQNFGFDGKLVVNYANSMAWG
ncbi:hypothetical protein GIB67_029980 [Kingdonia uniflora]|uniref:Ubiquitin-like protein ATG12 n=1 Tax=Kingdonia uniflora TaxID=39325 RepID=A0A7J7MY76_9MAGN|nr:hypothetical protein GIB67_029980 [Kingdonia uniflora]